MYNGAIVINKSPGFTSHDVVAKLRGITGQKKIGHTGTLDPDAEGVLIVCLGAATRISDMLMDESKEYEAVMLLGVTTDTQDMSGEVLDERSTKGLSEDEVTRAIKSFIGDISQIPPMYSAIKQNGKKLYELARAGVEVERKPRDITIHDIEIINMDLPEVTIRVSCSKGTYIRTLCNDIGEKLGCGASMKHLTRTKSGSFTIEKSLTLDEVQALKDSGRLDEAVTPLTDIFSDLRCAKASGEGIKKASNGNMLGTKDISPTMNDMSANEQILVTGEGGFIYGVYEYHASDRKLHPVKMFLC